MPWSYKPHWWSDLRTSRGLYAMFYGFHHTIHSPTHLHTLPTPLTIWVQYIVLLHLRVSAVFLHHADPAGVDTLLQGLHDAPMQQQHEALRHNAVVKGLNPLSQPPPHSNQWPYYRALSSNCSVTHFLITAPTFYIWPGEIHEKCSYIISASIQYYSS